MFSNNLIAGAAGQSTGFYPVSIDQSLRFNDNDSAYLNRTPASASNQKTWTFSAWVKRANIGIASNIFNPTTGGDGSNENQIGFMSDNRLRIYDSGGARGNLTTTQLFRDVSAWYHIVYSVDTTQATASDRIKLYVNGVQVTAFDVETYPSQNTDLGWNRTVRHDIGRYAFGATQYLDGYLAEVHFTDGTAYTADAFGELKSGVWVAKAPSVTYGTNGFYLDFATSGDGTTEDQSGNGNNWTENNLTASDVVLDSPTDNYPTFNPLATNMTLANGNKEANSTSDFEACALTMSCSGKNYFEIEYVTQSTGGGNETIGVVSYGQTTRNWQTAVSSGIGTNGRLGYAMTFEYSRTDAGVECDEGSVTSSVFTSLSAGDIAQIAVDTETGKIWFGTNGTWENSGDPAAGTNPSATKSWDNFTVAIGGHPTNKFRLLNNSDEWNYTPPTDYLALSTANLPEPTISPADDASPEDYFGIDIYTGTSTTHARSALNFQPDLVWIKNRSAADKHHMYDSVRGVQKALYPSETLAEADEPDGLLDFNANGFNVGSEVEVNTANEDYVAWGWKAGGTAVENTDGSITSQVSANTESGFSIVSYTGDGASNATVGHGLTVAPEMILVKNRSAFGSWCVYHSSLPSYQYILRLDSNGAQSTSNTSFGAAPSSTLFTVNQNSGTNNTNINTNDYIAYCFHSVEGFSKCGLYIGNGNADGPFVYCGFRPAFTLIKRYDATENWWLHDTKRDPTNIANHILYGDLPNAEIEGTGDNQSHDYLSNGFKLRTANANWNASGGDYLFVAFAENPFKYSNAR